MNNELEKIWRFPGNNYTQDQGIDTPDMETFAQDPIASLARETCQNSIDARIEGKTAKIQFKTFDIMKEDIPGIDRIEKEIDKKMDAIVEFAELDKFMGAKLGEYSSGMISRLAFATIIQTLQGIILVDEVLSVGDIAFQRKCAKAFEKVLNDGHTILFISHGLEKKLCTNALYIDHGNQMAFGPLKEVEDMYYEKMKVKK